jgi:hypothetical protein
MAWHVESVMDQRLCFIAACLRADASMIGCDANLLIRQECTCRDRCDVVEDGQRAAA